MAHLHAQRHHDALENNNLGELTLRKSDTRGFSEHGWLRSYHTFSFANYHDPKHMGFRSLLVLNEDRVLPHNGFPSHGHRNMEILSYVLEGQLAHKDSMGNGSMIEAGEVQRMTAGIGVYHSEYNASDIDPLHFLQIWISPKQKGLSPSYEQKRFLDSEKEGTFRLIASENGRAGSLIVHQDLDLYAAILRPGHTLEERIPSGRYAWLQVTRGALSVNGHVLMAGDGASLQSANEGSVIEIHSPLEGDLGEILLFNMA
jgi:redox-sensitive bicupin YhaK (pirin superfamily)